MASEEVPVQMDIELLTLLREWGMLKKTIELISECGICKVESLKKMHSCDISTIFHERCDLQQKIEFRYRLQKLKLQNNVSMVAIIKPIVHDM